jgi:hypothetical protein
MDIASVSPPVSAAPDSQPQMYQFQAAPQDRGAAANGISRPDNAATPVDRKMDRDPAFTGTTGPRVGDGLLRDFSRFAGMMQSIEPKRDARFPGMRGKSEMRGRIGDGPSKGSSAADAADSAVEKGLADMQRAAEYASYLSAMAVIVQNGVSGLKRLQQG